VRRKGKGLALFPVEEEVGFVAVAGHPDQLFIA
jgi:hypothetical protein